MDVVQKKCEAVLLQACLKQDWATFDVVRRLVEIPAGYRLNRISCVPTRMKANGLIVKVGMAVSCRHAAKNGTNRVWRLVSKTIARRRLRDLRDELGTDFPTLTKKDLAEARPRELHWQPSGKRKPIKGQRELF